MGIASGAVRIHGRLAAAARAARFALLIALLVARPAGAAPDDSTVGVRSPDGKLATYETVRFDGREYLSADDVSLIYSASKYWRPDLLKMTLRIGTRHVKVTAENRNVVIDERVVHLREPVLFRNGRMYLPLELAAEVLPPLVERYPVEWDGENRILSLGAPGVVLLGTWLNPLPDGVEIVVRPSVRVAAAARRDAGGVLTVLFPEARIGVDSLPSVAGLADDPGIDSLSWAIEGDTAALRIAMRDTLADYRIAREGRPERIVIRLSDSELAPESPKESSDLLILTTPGRAPQRSAVVIDPGHGGADRGSVGAGGLVEKDYVLDLANRIKERLARQYGITARLTREDDTDPPLSRRSEIANEAGGALLVSLHVNGSFLDDVRGTEVYVHAPGRGMETRIEAALEEATRRYEADLVGGVIDQDFRFVPWEAVQVSHRSESDSFARRLLRELEKVKGLDGCGVREGPFPVLAGADMPAVLVEIGYATNAGEERLLLQEETMEGIAAGIARAVRGFSGGGS